MNRPARALAAVAAACLCWSARAETLYVIDQVVVGVSSAANDTGEHIGTLRSGESVQVLERHDAYVRVRLPSGTDGWVKASYLSPQLPLQQQLAAQALEVERLKQEVSHLQGEARAAPLVAPTPDPPVAAAIVPADAPVQGVRPVWPWVLGAAAAALLGGFMLGWRMLDRRIRRKYGGLRIY
jgi:Bacterial SH3 domain